MSRERDNYEPIDKGLIQFETSGTIIPVFLSGQGGASENDPPGIEAPPAEITVRIKAEDLVRVFEEEEPYNMLLHLYYSGWSYSALTASIDYDIAKITGENAGLNQGLEVGPQEIWDADKIDGILGTQNEEELPDDEREFKLLWDLRVSSALLGIRFLETLELPENAENRYLRWINRTIGEKGPHRMSPTIRRYGREASDKIIALTDEDLKLNDSIEAQKRLQLQIVRFGNNFNRLVEFYSQPPAKFSKHQDPEFNRNACYKINNRFYAPNIDLKPGEYRRASLLLDITKRFKLWDQYKQINKDLGSPDGYYH